jgi:hypothetical protein
MATGAAAPSRRLVGRAVAVLLLAAATARAEAPRQPPPNQWTLLHDGPPGIIAHHARLLWLPDRGAGFLWANLNWTSRRVSFEEHAAIRFFHPAERRWTARASTFPEGARVEPQMVGQSYVYLPQRRRILVALPSHGRSKVEALGWLLDPATGRWEAIVAAAPLCDRSSSFNPAAGRDGSPMPLWGALVYDAHNGAGVLICGGGTWGRVGRAPEAVSPGDWLYDEQRRRIRRLTGRDAGPPARARKWYPANCGTWLFDEATGKWSPVDQPLGEQPSGRVLPGAAYDAREEKIVLFGGDDCTRCLAETWVFDCRTRTWRRAAPKASPPPRAACAMVYVPDQKVVLLAGGYGPGWVKLKDTWVYDTAGEEWTKLAMDLPEPGQYCSADYEPAGRTVILCPSNPSWGRHEKTVLYGLRLELASARRAPAPKQGDPRLDYHCKHETWPAPLPGEWLVGGSAAGDPQAGRKALAALPANTWVHRKPPLKARARVWGIYVYDARSHKGYAWGGGHGGYIGADVCEYDLLTNRWRGMADAVNYKLLWRHPEGGGSPGVSFQGWALMGTHARKSHGVDPLSDSIVTFHGDVYGIAERTFVANIGRCPGRYGLGDQVACVTTPHGFYGYHGKDGGALYRANVAAGKWDLIAKGGPPDHQERNHLCYDSRRDRLIYFRCEGADVWSFDFQAKRWAQGAPAGGRPARALGDSAYVPELDAAVMIFADAPAKDAPETMFLYRPGERKWHTAPYRGDRAARPNDGLSHSPIYDPQLKLLVRFLHVTREQWVETFVMRLDAETLELRPLR